MPGKRDGQKVRRLRRRSCRFLLFWSGATLCGGVLRPLCFWVGLFGVLAKKQQDVENCGSLFFWLEAVRYPAQLPALNRSGQAPNKSCSMFMDEKISRDEVGMRSPMNDEYLATGFGNVDASADGEAYKKCLSLLDSLPYYQEYKKRSYQLLDLLPGVSVLEVWCGLGDDALRMAALVNPGGMVTAVDASVRMIELAWGICLARLFLILRHFQNLRWLGGSGVSWRN